MSANGKILTRNTERADWPREKLLVCLHDCAYDSMHRVEVPGHM